MTALKLFTDQSTLGCFLVSVSNTGFPFAMRFKGFTPSYNNIFPVTNCHYLSNEGIRWSAIACSLNATPWLHRNTSEKRSWLLLDYDSFIVGCTNLLEYCIMQDRDASSSVYKTIKMYITCPYRQTQSGEAIFHSCYL